MLVVNDVCQQDFFFSFSKQKMELALKLFGSAALVGVITAISKIFFSPLPVLPYNKLLMMANERYSSTSSSSSSSTTIDPFPLLNKIVIVTGSTSGLGKEIAINLFRVSFSLFSFLFFLLF